MRAFQLLVSTGHQAQHCRRKRSTSSQRKPRALQHLSSPACRRLRHEDTHPTFLALSPNEPRGHAERGAELKFHEFQIGVASAHISGINKLYVGFAWFNMRTDA